MGQNLLSVSGHNQAETVLLKSFPYASYTFVIQLR